MKIEGNGMGTFVGLRRGPWLTAAMLTTLLAGCGGSPPPGTPLPELVPVSGTVTMGDEPISQAVVTFLPENVSGDGFGGFGLTDASGRYEVGTMYDGKSNPGLPVGKYKVIVSKMVAPDGKALPPDPEVPPAMQGGRESIPLPFCSPAQTPFRADIPAGGGDSIDFKVKKR
jgi:hypothetical protein